MEKNRLVTLFEEKQNDLLSIFFTAGYPSLDSTIEVARLVEAGGADFMEIGIPFSDPIADGPDIQASSLAAIGNGMSVSVLLSQLREIRKTVRAPIVLMGYLNPVLQFGWDAFCREAAACGADSLIIPDLPVDEYEADYQESMEASGLVPIFLVSPTTTEERIRRIDAMSRAFIYAVSDSGTTGGAKNFSQEQIVYFERLRSMKLAHPILIGFGIGNPIQYKAACAHASGAIIGSAFIRSIRVNPNEAEIFVRELRRGPVETVASR